MAWSLNASVYACTVFTGGNLGCLASTDFMLTREREREREREKRKRKRFGVFSNSCSPI